MGIVKQEFPQGTEAETFHDLAHRLLAVPAAEVKAKEAEYEALSKEEKREFNKRHKIKPRKD